MHGKGKLTYDVDHYYDGDWVRGKRHGRGIYLSPDGCKFEGRWMYKTGYIALNVIETIGSFENDRINGTGISWYPNGNKYEGQWKDGKIHGIGN